MENKKIKIKTNILIALFMILCGVPTLAIPVDPTPKQITMPNGKSITITEMGDEYYYCITTIDGYPIKKNGTGIFEYINSDLQLSGVEASNPVDRNTTEKTFIKRLDKKTILSNYVNMQLDRFKVGATVEVLQSDNTILSVKREKKGLLTYHTTSDGLLITTNDNGDYEYININPQTNEPMLSGILAHNPQKRSLVEQQFVSYLKAPNLKTFLGTPELDLLLIGIILDVFKKIKPVGTKGTQNVLVILMEFPDRRMKVSKAEFERQLRSPNYNGTGSVRDFYLENSYGQLNINFTVVGPYTSDNNSSHYEPQSNKAEPLMREAVRKANKDINYRNFDNNGDGFVDFVHIIYAGEAVKDKTIWPHQWQFNVWWAYWNRMDQKRFYQYSCSNELNGTVMEGIGTLCHELGHQFGAPDFYDTNYGNDGQYRGTDNWDLMAYGNNNGGGHRPAHFNPFVKTQIFGWATLNELPNKGNVILKPVSRSAGQWSFYKIPTSTPDEYFILENRQQIGFDSSLPGHGLMIYHVHPDMRKVESDTRDINIKHPQKLYPVSAGATQNPSNSPESYEPINSYRTPFNSYSQNAFTANTIPSAKSWHGVPVSKELFFIQENGENVSLVVNEPIISGSDQICKEGVYQVNGLPSQTNLSWSYYAHNSNDKGLPITLPPHYSLYAPMYYYPEYNKNKHSALFKRGKMRQKKDNVNLSDYAIGIQDTIVPYTGNVTIYADIRYPLGMIHPNNKRISKTIFVGNTIPSIVICAPKYHQIIAQPYTDTDYTIEVRFPTSIHIESNASIEWEISSLFPSSYTTIIESGHSFKFHVSKIPNYESQTILIKVRYTSRECGLTEWFSKTFTFVDKNAYYMTFSNPASNNTEISVFKGNDDHSSYNIPYEGNYEIELWNDYGMIKKIYNNTHKSNLPLGGLIQGVYYIRLIINGQLMESKQIIVK